MSGWVHLRLENQMSGRAHLRIGKSNFRPGPSSVGKLCIEKNAFSLKFSAVGEFFNQEKLDIFGARFQGQKSGRGKSPELLDLQRKLP
jgi:hypothetical protein